MWFCVIFHLVSWAFQFRVLIRFSFQSLTRIRLIFVVKLSLPILEFQSKDHDSDITSGSKIW